MSYKILEYDEYFLLMQGKEIFYILPKAGFSEDELEIIRKTDRAAAIVPQISNPAQDAANRCRAVCHLPRHSGSDHKRLYIINIDL